MHTDLLLTTSKTGLILATHEASVRSDDDASLILVPLGIKLTLELELLCPAPVARFTGAAMMAALVSESDASNSLR